MGTTKANAFNDKQNSMATLIKAMAHPARIIIVNYLIKVESCVSGKFVGEVNLAQPTISQHLKELKNAELITGTVDGVKSCYCINWKKFDQFNLNFTSLFQNLKKQFDKSCC